MVKEKKISTGKKKADALLHHSLPVDLVPGTVVTVRLVKTGYLTQEFVYTVPSTAATVTKTMVAEKYEATITAVSLDKTTCAPGELVTMYYTFKNTGNMPTDIITRRYLDGVLKATATFTGVAPGDSESSGGGDPAPTTLGSHVMKLTVAPAGKAITDTKELSFTVAVSAGTLSVSTSPTGASIRVGTETKTSPCNFTLAPGTYTVTVSKAGYDTITDSITITSGKTTTKSYTLVLSTVTITFDTKKEDGTTLTGVDVYVNGVKKGTT
jgi:hypothetical protein